VVVWSEEAATTGAGGVQRNSRTYFLSLTTSSPRI